MTARRLLSLTFAFAFLTGCDITGVEPLITITGTVVAATAGGGYTAGQAIDGAQVTLRYQKPLEPQSVLRDSDVTTAAGAYSVRSGPPAGQNEPNCSTLSISVVKSLFQTTTVRLTGLCTGAGELNDLVIELTPS